MRHRVAFRRCSRRSAYGRLTDSDAGQVAMQYRYQYKPNTKSAPAARAIAFHSHQWLIGQLTRAALQTFDQTNYCLHHQAQYTFLR